MRKRNSSARLRICASVPEIWQLRKCTIDLVHGELEAYTANIEGIDEPKFIFDHELEDI